MSKTDDLVSQFKMKPGNTWGAGVLVLNPEGLALVGLRKDTHDWGTPGGTIKVGETPLEGVIRECYEESKLTIKKPEFMDVHTGPVGDRIWVSFCFIAKNVTGETKAQPSEVVEWKWVTIEAMKKMKLFPPARRTLEIAIERGMI